MNEQTILLRQVHPAFIPEGELTSQAFMPFPKDRGKLSVYDGDRIGSEEAHRHYTMSLGFESAGVWGVSGAETTSTGLRYAADPLENSPAHALIDFTAHPEKDFRKLAKKLKALAAARGCLYAPRQV